MNRDKTCYVGNAYGYTGSTAAFVSLYHGFKEDRLETGKYLAIVSAGLGGFLSTVLMKIVK